MYCVLSPIDMVSRHVSVLQADPVRMFWLEGPVSLTHTAVRIQRPCVRSVCLDWPAKVTFGSFFARLDWTYEHLHLVYSYGEGIVKT